MEVVEALLDGAAEVAGAASLCALGKTASDPLLFATVRDFERHSTVSLKAEAASESELLAAIEGVPIKFPFDRFKATREAYKALVAAA